MKNRDLIGYGFMMTIKKNYELFEEKVDFYKTKNISMKNGDLIGWMMAIYDYYDRIDGF